MIENKHVEEKIAQILTKADRHSDLFLLYGHINQHMVNSSIEIIENKLIKLKYSKTMISKTKLLGVEIMENMFKHQFKNHSLSPYFHLSVSGSGLTIVSGNSISSKRQKILKQKLDKYESLTPEELRVLYLKQLGKGKITKQGNAGLGILTIYNRSKKNSSYKLSKINDSEYYFSMEVNLLKD